MKKIKRKITVFLTLCAVFTSSLSQVAYGAVQNDVAYPIETNDISGWPQMGDLYSESACLMDAETGAILVNKGMDSQKYPASITKVMTVLLALENSNLSDSVTFTEEGLARMAEGTNIASQAGEVLTMEQCLYIIMIVSANEVAAQVAIQIGGSEAAFAEMMNARAAELGCTNTHFTNASGLPDENHYTSAHDMARIFQAAMKNEEFMKIIQTRDYNLPATNMNPQVRGYHTHLALVSPVAPEYYPDCIGGKTGVTLAAKSTLVTAAQRDGKTFIAVVLRADDSGKTCADSTALYEYGFANFTRMDLGTGSAMVPNGTKADDLLTEVSTEDGSQVNYYYGTQYVGTALNTEETVETTETPAEENVANEDSQVQEQDTDTTQPEVTHSYSDNPMLQYKMFAAVVGGMGGLIVFGILMILISLIARRKS